DVCSSDLFEEKDDDEVLQKIDLLQDYFGLLDLMKERNWEEALEASEIMMKNEYIVDSLRVELELLTGDIETSLENEKEVTDKLEKIRSEERRVGKERKSRTSTDNRS